MERWLEGWIEGGLEGWVEGWIEGGLSRSVEHVTIIAAHYSFDTP